MWPQPSKEKCLHGNIFKTGEKQKAPEFGKKLCFSKVFESQAAKEGSKSPPVANMELCFSPHNKSSFSAVTLTKVVMIWTLHFQRSACSCGWEGQGSGNRKNNTTQEQCQGSSDGGSGPGEGPKLFFQQWLSPSNSKSLFCHTLHIKNSSSSSTACPHCQSITSSQV